jgi:hypothetical protein
MASRTQKENIETPFAEVQLNEQMSNGPHIFFRPAVTKRWATYGYPLDRVCTKGTSSLLDS